MVTTWRRRFMCRKQAGMLFVSLLALVLSETKGSVFDTPQKDLEDEDYVEYVQEVSIATAGLGVGLSIAFGFIAFIAMLAMCCRCKRLHRADLAIAQAEGDNDGKGLDDMYEIEDYEDHISKHRKILWLFSLIIFLGYLFCAGYAYNGAKTTDASFGAIFDGTDVLLTRVQTALCAENGGQMCASNSVGDFMLTISNALEVRLDGVVAFITSLSAIAAPLSAVSSSLVTAGEVIDATEGAVLSINDSITNVNLILTGEGRVAEFTDGEAIDTISPNTLAEVEDGRAALIEAGEMTEESTASVEESLSGNDSEIVQLKYQIDDIRGNESPGDTNLRQQALDLIQDVVDPMRNMTEDVYEVQNDEIVDARELIDGYLDMAVKAVAGLIFLPGVILFLTSLCSGICQSSKPLYINMCFVFLTQILFCLVAGIFLAISKLNSDVCEHHLSLIEANFQESNTTVRGVDIVFDFPTFEKVLTCDGQADDPVTASNNLVDIFGAQQIFNISTTLEETSSVITDNSDLLLAPQDSLVSAQDNLDPLNDFVDQDFVGDVDTEAKGAEIDDLLADLPPEPFDWDNRTHQDSLDDYYLKNITEYSWNNETTGDITYRGQLEDVNALIAGMVAGIIGQGAFASIRNPYNFEEARALTNETVCFDDSPFYPATDDDRNSASTGQQIYTTSGDHEILCITVTAYYETTLKLEDLVRENGDTRIELEEVQYEMGLINSNITVITDQQALMGELRDDMNNTLGGLSNTLDALVVELNGLAADINSLNEVVMGASNYTKCGYIGDFYQDVYLDAMCTDLQGNIEAVAGPALTVVILMFLSFCIQGCYGPSMRKRPRGTAGDFEGGKTRLNQSGENEYNLPTPHSPTPLVGNSGF